MRCSGARQRVTSSRKTASYRDVEERFWFVMEVAEPNVRRDSSSDASTTGPDFGRLHRAFAPALSVQRGSFLIGGGSRSRKQAFGGELIKHDHLVEVPAPNGTYHSFHAPSLPVQTRRRQHLCSRKSWPKIASRSSR